ncbi:MAG: flavin reductase family protein [Elusimicrobium sp.]|jgi:ferric-chelate reductase [NAD(P)H]|nr:flavin reductase family protein [Elusimicrobium sp.]
MIDGGALLKIPYGVYILSSFKDDKINAMIINSAMQVTAEPARIAVSVNKRSLTYEYILASGVFALMPLTEKIDFPFIGRFGFRSGRNFDKFAGVKYEKGVLGAPVVLENTTAVIEARADKNLDVGTHVIFAGEIKEARNICAAACLTYDYYRNVIKGKTPQGATHQ